MENTIKLKELRPRLPEVINNIDKLLDRYIVTKRGKPVAAMMSIDDYKGLLETIEILSDKQAVNRVKLSKKEISDGKTVSLKELRKRLEDV